MTVPSLSPLAAYVAGVLTPVALFGIVGFVVTFVKHPEHRRGGVLLLLMVILLVLAGYGVVRLIRG